MTSLIGKLTTLISAAALVLMCACLGGAQQFRVGGLVPISELGKPTLITKPVLTPRGGQLIFSDSPEQLKETTPLPGAMYRDQEQGEFRIFYHHQNETSGGVTVGVALTNSDTRSELLFSRGQGQGLNIYPDVAGQTALSEFISTHVRPGFLGILLPGQTYWLVQSVPQGDTASAILEFVVVAVPSATPPSSVPLELFEDLSPHPSGGPGQVRTAPPLPPGFALGAVTATVAAYNGAQPSDPTILPILLPGRNTRGTFPHFDRYGTIVVSVSGGLQALPVDSNYKSASAMMGEYEPGVDAVDGGVPVYDNGNYGVLYHFRIRIQNSFPPRPTPMALMMQPSGGSGHYVMSSTSGLALSPFVSYKSAWWFNELTVRGPVQSSALQTSLTGGSSGPQKLLFDPGFTGQ